MNGFGAASCLGKVRFASYSQAEKINHRKPKRRKIAKRHKHTHGGRMIYRCKFCQGYHIGSKEFD